MMTSRIDDKSVTIGEGLRRRSMGVRRGLSGGLILYPGSNYRHRREKGLGGVRHDGEGFITSQGEPENRATAFGNLLSASWNEIAQQGGRLCNLASLRQSLLGLRSNVSPIDNFALTRYKSAMIGRRSGCRHCQRYTHRMLQNSGSGA